VKGSENDCKNWNTPPSLRPAKNDRIVGKTSRLDLPRIAFGWKLGSAFRSFGPLNVLCVFGKHA
jgi:hypothetical protein